MARNEALKKRLFDLDSAEIRVGQEVILTIINEGEYSGKISLINAKRDRLQLENVTFCQTKAKLSSKKFYKQEIKSIEIISEEIVGEETNQNNAFEIEKRKKFQICGKDFERIKRLTTTHHSTINCVGEDFDGAVDDILKQNVIGLNADGVENGRNGAITIIGISTPFRIYIFNIKVIGGIDNRLKDILKSDDRVKVIHDARLLADNLFHCHGVHLKGIFDTMVAHRSLGYSNKPTTLQQCITKNMVLPSEFVEAIIGDIEVGDIALVESTAHSIEAFIKQTAILLKFHDFLTEELLQNAYRSFNDHLNFCRNKDSCNVQFIYRDANSIERRMNEIPQFKLNEAVEQ